MVLGAAFQTILSGAAGLLHGQVNRIFSSLAERSEADKEREFKKYIFTHKLLAKQHHENLLDIQDARKNAKETRFTRRLIVSTACIFVLSMIILAVYNVPFAYYEVLHRKILWFEWDATRLTYVHAMPIFQPVIDVFIYACTFSMGQKRL